MKKIELLIQEFENLNTEELSDVTGGFVGSSTMEERKEDETVVNKFQCGCNNYCPKKFQSA